MSAGIWIMALATLGVDVGWEPLSAGGAVYIIQIEPEMLDTLRAGYAVVSDLPPGLDVRTFRVVVGDGELPKIAPPQSNESNFAPSLNHVLTVTPPAAETSAPNLSAGQSPSADNPQESEAGYRGDPGAQDESTAANDSAGMASALPLLAKWLPANVDWRRWLPWIAFSSLGANLFLLWLAWSERSRFRAYLRNLRGDDFRIEPVA